MDRLMPCCSEASVSRAGDSLCRPGRNDQRPAAIRPDHHCGPAFHGKDCLRHEHCGERLHRRSEGGRHVSLLKCRVRPCCFVCCVPRREWTRTRSVPVRCGRMTWTKIVHAMEQAGACPDFHRRHARYHAERDARQGEAPASNHKEPRPDHRRLPAAHVRRRPAL